MSEIRNEARQLLEAWADQFIASMEWSDLTTDETRSIVIGNVRGFSAGVINALAPLLEDRPTPNGQWLEDARRLFEATFGEGHPVVGLMVKSIAPLHQRHLEQQAKIERLEALQGSVMLFGAPTPDRDGGWLDAAGELFYSSADAAKTDAKNMGLVWGDIVDIDSKRAKWTMDEEIFGDREWRLG